MRTALFHAALIALMCACNLTIALRVIGAFKGDPRTEVYKVNARIYVATYYTRAFAAIVGFCLLGASGALRLVGAP